MSITINAIELYKDITDCMTVEVVRLATINDEQLDMLLEYVLHGQPSARPEGH